MVSAGSRASVNMPSLRPWEQRLTPIDLFEEKRKTSWIWRAIASSSTMIMGIGYLLYPFAVKKHLHNQGTVKVTTSTSILIVSILLVIIAHTLEGIVLLRNRSLLFLMENIFMPIVQITFLTGVVSPILHLAIRISTSKALPGVFAISGVSLLIHVPIAILMQRQIMLIEQSDLLRRQRGGNSQGIPTLRPQASQKSQTGRSVSFRRTLSRSNRAPPANRPVTAEDVAHLMPEEEAQRQQLLKLLLKKEYESRPPVVTGAQGGGVQSTYRVDIPVPDADDIANRHHLWLPFSLGNGTVSTYTEQGINTYQSTAPYAPDERSRQASASSQGSRMETNQPVGEHSYLDSGTSGTQPSYNATNDLSTPTVRQDQSRRLRPTPSQLDRERRRKEIEQGEAQQPPVYRAESIAKHPSKDQKVTWVDRYG